MKYYLLALLLSALGGVTAAAAGDSRVPDHGAAPGLALAPARVIAFDADEGTWMSLDVAPDGEHFVFDLLGDIYRLPISGGAAEPILTGMAFESQPVYSPDNAKIAFISDRSGSENLWIANTDGGAPRQLTFVNDNSELISPEWSSDGKYIYFSSVRPDILAFELWRVDASTGTSRNIVKAKGTPRDQRMNSIGARPHPDGAHVVASELTGSMFGGHEKLPGWRVVKRNLATGETQTLVSARGGAIRPVVSPDGRWLVYGTRTRGESLLRLRDLESGADTVLVRGATNDQQEAWPTMDLLPRYDFTPDGAALIFTANGKFERVDMATHARTLIPFTAHVEQPVGASLRQDIPAENGPVRARLIQSPVLSPDGRETAFSALSRIYIAGEGAPAPLTDSNDGAYQPAWAPDGQALAYVSWEGAGGALWRKSRDGGEAEKLTDDGAYYSNPVFSADGKFIYALRSSQYDRLHAVMDYFFHRPADLVRIDLSGGDIVNIAHGQFGGPPQFVRGDKRIFISSASGLNAIDPATGKQTIVAAVTGPSYYFLEGRSPVEEYRISPDGKWLLAKIVSQLYLLPTPKPGAKISLDVSDANAKVRRLTDVGADFIGWRDDGREIFWAIGATLNRLAFSPALLSQAKITPEAALIEVFLPRDTPEGALVLRGATAITMDGDEIVKNADVVIVDNKIAAVGKRGAVDIPKGAEIRRLKGKFILPGFIDTHAHWSYVRHDVMEPQPQGYLSYLAYGVTGGLDPSTLTIDALAYQDMIDAGLMVGPRTYSTGPAIFSRVEIDTLDDARAILRRYKDHYRVQNVKQYRVGDRRRRQLFAIAAGELGLMPTTEGATNFKLGLTQIIDGFAGHEHTLPAFPLHDDIIDLMAPMQIGYTLTLMNSNGATPGANYFFPRYDYVHDKKLQRFTPPEMLDAKMERITHLADHEFYMDDAAQGAAALQRAGGVVGVGSHTELDGLGYHWEMQAMAMGGMRPHEVLHAATIGSARTIGRAGHIGSLEPGKFADLIVLDENPLDDLSNTLSISQVMKNGRLYEAESMDEIWPRQQARPPLWFDTAQEQ